MRPRRRVFDSIVALVSWTIWLERNEYVFRGMSRLPSQMVATVLAELESWCRASVVDR
jgi:hypothetical protein